MGCIPNNAETQSQCRRGGWERFPGAETSALMGKTGIRDVFTQHSWLRDPGKTLSLENQGTTNAEQG